MQGAKVGEPNNCPGETKRIRTLFRIGSGSSHLVWFDEFKNLNPNLPLPTCASVNPCEPEHFVGLDQVTTSCVVQVTAESEDDSKRRVRYAIALKLQGNIRIASPVYRNSSTACFILCDTSLAVRFVLGRLRYVVLVRTSAYINSSLGVNSKFERMHLFSRRII
ncbi:hypothetical protein BHM03_00035573 [Ensete ventricosum]|nr:hypothetical protein BHM03_00035573 [Ensete ventricosum]